MGMAKRNYSKRSSKIEPSVQTLYFRTSTVLGGGISTFYVDLSQVASLVNRRFYRQGINWAVAGFKFFSNPGTLANISVSKLPNTWVLANSWEKGMRAWTKMNRMALEEAPSVRPKFLDFKVFADAKHAQQGVASNLLPHDFQEPLPQPYALGEWEMSKFVLPDTTSPVGGINNYEIIATGASYPGPGASSLNSVSLIEGYAASRGLPEILDPNTQMMHVMQTVWPLRISSLHCSMKELNKTEKS